MNKHLLIITVLKNVAIYFGLTESDEADFYMHLNNENIENAFSSLESVNNRTASFQSTLFYLESLILMDYDQFTLDDWNWVIHDIDFSFPDYKHLNRSFRFKNDVYCYIHCTLLVSGFSNNPVISFQEEDQKLTLQLFVSFFNRTSINRVEIDKFYSILYSNSISDAYLLSKNNYSSNTLTSILTLIYGSFLAKGGRLSTESSLVYNSNHSLNSSIFDQITNFSDFDQYMELLDVFNAVNSTNVLIDRFMKVFNLIEYLIYRMYLVELVDGVNRSRFFVRELMKINKKDIDREKSYFIDNFPKLFASGANYGFDVVNLGNLLISNNASNFLKNNYKVTVNTSKPLDIQKLANIIYSIRCSIVHSKESEFHISVSNVSDYVDLIPFIREFIEKVECIIFMMIANRYDKITYDTRDIKLY